MRNEDALTDLAGRLREASTAPLPEPPPCAGRGIVICAGGARLFTCAWLLVAMLRRRLACALPIELWHIGPAELGPPMRRLLEMFDVEVVDAVQVAAYRPAETLGGWQLKTFALLHSRFEQVLLLDADNMPVADPAPLFDDAAFAGSGAVFWPDIVRLKPGNPIWALMGLPPEAGPAFETGQLLLDKGRHRRALQLAHWINQEHVAFEEMLYGDKDAFYVAWRTLAAGFHLIPHRPRLLDGTFCQRSPAGEVLFQHRNRAKWQLHGVNPRVEGFRLEEECFALLSELRTRWDGEVFNPPPRPAGAQAVERRIASIGRFSLAWIGSHDHDVVLHDGHLIEGGGTEGARYWFVAGDAAMPELTLVGQRRRRCVLRCGPDGVWRGEAGGVAVELRPEQAPDAGGGNALHDAAVLLAESLLDRAPGLPDPVLREFAITLATLAAVDGALTPFLRSCAARPPVHGRRAALAGLAVQRLEAMPLPAPPPGPGTGWQSRSGNLDVQTERLPEP